MMSEASTTDYEIAVERGVGFLQQFGSVHFDLACHAAFPLVLTPDLLYQIWLRFVPQAPWTAVARVLLSRLCREVGYELYEMDIAVRNWLLTELKKNEEFNKDKPRLEELADFLTSYVTQQFAGDNPQTKKLAQGQYWTALAYTKPERLSRELLEAINLRLQQKNWKELFRLSSLVETFAEPLAEFAPLLITYARGMASFTVGDVESATEQFSKLPRRDRLVDIDGVNLSIPDEVPLTTVELDFLLKLLQIISESDGNPQIVYPILRDNLDKLDDSFAALLGSWAATILPNVELEKAQGITVNITTLSNLLTEFPLGNRANNVEIAITGYEIALSLFTRDNFPEQWAMIQNYLAVAYIQRIRGDNAENLERAISCFKAALQVRTREAFPVAWANTKSNLGIAYRDRIRGERAENIERAIACFGSALTVYTREAFPQQWANTQNNLGIAYRDCIRGERAENIERAIAYFESALTVYTREAFPQNHLETLFNLAFAYQDTRQLNSVYDVFANAIDILESFQSRTFYRWEIKGDKQEFTEQSNKVYQRMVAVCLQLGYTDKALEYVERSKAYGLVELLANYDLQPKGNIPDFILNKLQRLRREILIEQLRLETKDKNRFIEDDTLGDDSQLLGDNSLISKNWIRLTQLQQQLDELINREILPIDPEFNLTQRIEPITFAQIQSIIPDERTAILEWYLQDENFQTFIITPQSDIPSVWQSSVENGSALIEWTNEYFQDYLENKRKWQEQLSLRLQNLTQILHLDEILNYLPATCDQLILIPHRFLHCIPLHALPLADGSCLLDRFPSGVRYAPSCQLLQLVQTRQRPEFSHFFAIQNPHDDLTYADIEVETIKQYFPDADVLAKAAATKEALNNPTLQSIHCLHFSGHSDFNIYSPLQSRLYFADEPVTLAEIFTLDLSQCRLVTLSASETALTDWTSASDEYIGFPGAFLLAGSTNIVGSLWAPSDLSTALLMIKFYQNLRTGFTVAVALNQAQLWLRDVTQIELQQWIENTPLLLDATVRMNLHRRLHTLPDDAQPFREPFHWAAFCAIGQ